MTSLLPPPPSAPREVELKLFVPSCSIDSLWTHPLIVARAIGPLSTEQLENRYFDTADRALMRQRMALRLRRIGKRWLQTLKVSHRDEGALSTRDEWEMPVAGPRLVLDLLHETPLAVLPDQRTLATRLQCVFTTDFRRESRLLRLDDGAEVEIAFDVGRVAAGRGAAKRTVPIREVEIELKGGGSDDPEAALLRFAARLARDIALVPLAASKAARGFRLADRRALEPAVIALPKASLDDGPRAFLARVLRNGNASLLVDAHALFEIASDGLDVEASSVFIHHARIVVRRMGSALRLFREVASGKRFTVLDTRLRAIGHALGEVRDRDVFTTIAAKRLASVVATDDAGRDALAVVHADVTVQRGIAFDALMAHLCEPAFGAAMLAVERAALRLANGRERGRATTLATAVPPWLADQRRRIVRSARRIAVLDMEQRHAVRIEVKRLRHALDLLAGLYDEAASKPMRDALVELQDRFGRLNDLTASRALVQTLPASPSRDLVLARLDAWFASHLHKQLPKIAAHAVAFELLVPPWAWPSAGHPAGDPVRG